MAMILQKQIGGAPIWVYVLGAGGVATGLFFLSRHNKNPPAGGGTGAFDPGMAGPWFQPSPALPGGDQPMVFNITNPITPPATPITPVNPTPTVDPPTPTDRMPTDPINPHPTPVTPINPVTPTVKDPAGGSYQAGIDFYNRFTSDNGRAPVRSEWVNAVAALTGVNDVHTLGQVYDYGQTYLASTGGQRPDEKTWYDWIRQAEQGILPTHVGNLGVNTLTDVYSPRAGSYQAGIDWYEQQAATGHTPTGADWIAKMQQLTGINNPSVAAAVHDYGATYLHQNNGERPDESTWAQWWRDAQLGRLPNQSSSSRTVMTVGAPAVPSAGVVNPDHIGLPVAP